MFMYKWRFSKCVVLGGDKNTDYFFLTFFAVKSRQLCQTVESLCIQPENDEIETEEQMQCTLTAVCKNPPYNMNITAVDILSSAKTIEVCNQIFRKLKIYHHTFSNIFLRKLQKSK